jgi:hypothetical protein
LKRLSTSRCAHLRSGLNSTAATSVEAATPTDEENRKTSVVSSTTPM